MAIKTGSEGKLALGANQVANIKDWKLNTGFTKVEYTNLGEDWDQNQPTTGNFKATASGQFEVDTDTNGQTAIQTAYLAKTSVALRLYVDATQYYSGTAFISKLDVENTAKGIVTISFEFTGTGALTFV
jgi:predicted secreted protein